MTKPEIDPNTKLLLAAPASGERLFVVRVAQHDSAEPADFYLARQSAVERGLTGADLLKIQEFAPHFLPMIAEFFRNGGSPDDSTFLNVELPDH